MLKSTHFKRNFILETQKQKRDRNINLPELVMRQGFFLKKHSLHPPK